MAGSMEGKGGLVTGAASGIGRACAIRFARKRAAVIVADLESSRAGGEPTVQEIVGQGGRAEFFACDVSRPADNEALVAQVVGRSGRLDFAHNNAGIGVHRLLPVALVSAREATLEPCAQPLRRRAADGRARPGAGLRTPCATPSWAAGRASCS